MFSNLILSFALATSSLLLAAQQGNATPVNGTDAGIPDFGSLARMS